MANYETGKKSAITCAVKLYDTLTIAVDKANSTTLEMQGFAFGCVSIPAGATIVTITVFASMDNSNWYAAYDNDNVAITLTVAASRIVQLPESIAAFPFVRFQGNAAEAGAKVFLKR